MVVQHFVTLFIIKLDFLPIQSNSTVQFLGSGVSCTKTWWISNRNVSYGQIQKTAAYISPSFQFSYIRSLAWKMASAGFLCVPLIHEAPGEAVWTNEVHLTVVNERRKF